MTSVASVLTLAHSASSKYRAEELEIRVSTALLRALTEVVLQRGVGVDQLLGRRRDMLLMNSGEHMLPLTEFQAILARAVTLTGEPGLGLLIGLHASEASYGLMAPLVAHAPSLRAALAVVCQFKSLIVEGVRVRVTERMGTARFRCDLNSLELVDRGFVELIVAGQVRALRGLGCAQHDIRAVCFAHRRPAHYPCYSVAFGGIERFEQEFTGVEFSAHVLDRPNLHHMSDLHALMVAQAERSLERHSRQLSCTERVRGLLSGKPLSRTPAMLAAARELGLSGRSLRRRLESEGTSYRELVQARRYEQACTLLRNHAVALQDAAHALGFSDAAGFHRAFRRWTKLTPNEYRAGFRSRQL